MRSPASQTAPAQAPFFVVVVAKECLRPLRVPRSATNSASIAAGSLHRERKNSIRERLSRSTKKAKLELSQNIKFQKRRDSETPRRLAAPAACERGAIISRRMRIYADICEDGWIADVDAYLYSQTPIHFSSIEKSSWKETRRVYKVREDDVLVGHLVTGGCVAAEVLEHAVEALGGGGLSALVRCRGVEELCHLVRFRVRASVGRRLAARPDGARGLFGPRLAETADLFGAEDGSGARARGERALPSARQRLAAPEEAPERGRGSVALCASVCGPRARGREFWTCAEPLGERESCRSFTAGRLLSRGRAPRAPSIAELRKLRAETLCGDSVARGQRTREALGQLLHLAVALFRAPPQLRQHARRASVDRPARRGSSPTALKIPSL